MRPALAKGGLAVVVAGTLGLIIYESVTNAGILRYLTDVTSISYRSSSSSPSREGRSNAKDAAQRLFGRLSHTTELCDLNGTTPLGAQLAELVPRLNDVTIEMSPCVYRPWVLNFGNNNENHLQIESLLRDRPIFATMSSSPPPYKVLLTNFGWNHPDRTVGLNVSRSIRDRELLRGVINHPYFDPTDWDEVQRQVLVASNNKTATVNNDGTETRYYAFLDVETCLEGNYPKYGGGLEGNRDTIGGRTIDKDRIDMSCCRAPWCPGVHQVLESPLFRLRPNATKIVYLDCYGDAMPWERRKDLLNHQFTIASISAKFQDLDLRVDQGLPPPAVSDIPLTAQQVRDIYTCDAERNRTYLFTFVGSVRNSVRDNLTQLHDPEHNIISLPMWRYRDELADGTTPIAFPDMLRGSLFSGTPEGDNLFSYRFTEVLASGAIPVVHSDGWVLPFRPELVDWS